MKCWKCGTENESGSGSCENCGSSLERMAPVTKIGKAMRKLYDDYGAAEVLSNEKILVNGLGELYLQQLETGSPDQEFDNIVRELWTDHARLNGKAAEEISGYFDEI